MKRFWVIVLLVLSLSCDNDGTNRNPFLQEIGFRFSINLNLPLYSPLTITGNTIYIDNSAVGLRGVFVTNTGFNVFRVFEASCPNQPPSACTTMELNGTVATCSCDDFEYSTFTGQLLNRPDDGSRYYDMLEYNASFSGNTVIISN